MRSPSAECRQRAAAARRNHCAAQAGAEHTLVCDAQEGDSSARAQLVEELRPLVASVARLYQRCPGVTRAELMQEGVVGMLRALERYDPGFGTPFWAYASWWVRQAMQRLVAELGQPVVLSDRALRQLARVKDARREHLQTTGSEPSSQLLATATGLSRRQIDQLVVAERAPRALEEPLGPGDGRPGTFGELLADPTAEDEYERVLVRLEMEERHIPFGDLGERERGILRDRFGLDGREQTLREIAARLGLSAERVRQIEQRALGQLREC